MEGGLYSPSDRLQSTSSKWCAAESTIIGTLDGWQVFAVVRMKLAKWNTYDS